MVKFLDSPINLIDFVNRVKFLENLFLNKNYLFAKYYISIIVIIKIKF